MTRFLPRTMPPVLAMVLIASGCIGTAPPRDVTGDSSRGSGTPKVLTLSMEGEPEMLFTSLFGQGTDPGNSLKRGLHQKLAVYDGSGAVHPQLATSLPTQSAGTWITRPDGTMQTTYSLRREVTWHDGAPLTARDFQFAWAIYVDPSLPMANRSLASKIAAIDAPDDYTLVIEWKTTHPFANAIDEDDLGPIPHHLLNSLYEQDRDLFARSTWFNREFVGVGPYRLADWMPGSQLTLHAYDRFYRGKARIDTIIGKFIPSNPTVVANLLSGAIDGTLGTAGFTEMMVARREWEAAGRKPVLQLQVGGWRMLSVQFRPEVVAPREILDVRLRRALLTAIDRQAMSETLFDGLAPISDSIIPPSDVKWDWVRDVATTYPYDQRRASEQLASFGWQRGADGLWTSAGEPVATSLWTTTGEREIAIVADYWKAVGITTGLTVLGEALTRDIRLRASYPGFDFTRIPIAFENMLNRTYSAQCPTEQNRWIGNNRGCYHNGANDRVIDTLRTAIDPDEQRRLYRDLIRGQTEDLPVLPLYFDVSAWLLREGIVGPNVSSERSGLLWNVETWDIR
jgi:peptide/nickel transport system substrate-binding protein